MRPAKLPVGQQFRPVQFRPVKNKAQGAARQETFHHIESLYLNYSLVLVIARMKVRRRMIVEVEANKDAKEFADSRHCIPRQASKGRLNLRYLEYLECFQSGRHDYLITPRSLRSMKAIRLAMSSSASCGPSSSFIFLTAEVVFSLAASNSR
jgi:hypothetical protein